MKRTQTLTPVVKQNALVPISSTPAARGLMLCLVSTNRADANEQVARLRILDGVAHAELTPAQLQFIALHMDIAANMEDGWLNRHQEATQHLIGVMGRWVRDRKQREATNRKQDKAFRALVDELETRERAAR